jgi:predicted small lipoprotein YifL
MKFRALAYSRRHVIVPMLSMIILSSLAGCGGSGPGAAPKVGGAKVDPEVEAQNRAAIETYNNEKTKKQ